MSRDLNIPKRLNLATDVCGEQEVANAAQTQVQLAVPGVLAPAHIQDLRVQFMSEFSPKDRRR